MLRFVLDLLAIFCLAGCEEQSGEAIMLTKEHIAAAPPTSETATPNASAASEEQPRPIEDDEITVDGYVMKPEVRGTGRDPRALKNEQWRIQLRMIYDGRRFNVQAE